MKTITTLISTILLSISFGFAQNKIANSTEIYNYLRDSNRPVNFSDLENLKNVGAFKSDNSDITYNYFKQTYNGIPIFNSHISVALKNNQILSVQSNFIEGIQQLQHKNSLSISASQIEQIATSQLGFTPIQHNEMGEGHSHKFGIRTMPEPQLTYFQKDQELILSYEIFTHVKTEQRPTFLHMIVSAVDGSILHLYDTSLACNFDQQSFSNPNRESRNKILFGNHAEEVTSTTQALNETSQYRIFDLPTQSPIHGNRSLRESPYHPQYSPLGWHRWDFENQSFQFTKGNNAVVVHDQDSEILLQLMEVGYFEDMEEDYVHGTGGYNFDFPINFDLHPYDNRDAAVTNLFYHINNLHDIFYHYGFNEAAGNFQFENFSDDGADFDGAVVLAQTGEALGEMNDALIYLGNDGSQPIILFYIFRPAYTIGSPSIDLLQIDTPGPSQGIFKGMLAGFGPPPTQLSAPLAIMRDTNSQGNDSYDGCDDAINPQEVQGKIAVVRRGTCPFLQKAWNAQLAGAEALVVVNNVPGPIEQGMGGIDPALTIPSIIISKEDGDQIIASLENGSLTGSMPPEGVDVMSMHKDSAFDNGIIAHEFGHGVSARLTGGADNTCLTNLEQMGEGWSDFFASLLTIEPGDLGTDPRGMANYVIMREPNENGIRPSPYSTDMSINPSTFATLATYTNEESPHRLGYVWATMLWDMTWNLIDKYGFNADIYASTGGNNIALNLVMEGLKLQPCTPGFVDGRDAILMADEILYNGANKCEIWKAFSRRGLGYNANQGSVHDRLDGVANFEMPPSNILDCDSMAVNEWSMNIAQVFPNPTSGILTINTVDKNTQLAIQLVDLSGKLILSQSVKLNGNSGTIDISAKPAGVYVLKVNTPKGNQSFKIIKK